MRKLILSLFLLFAFSEVSNAQNRGNTYGYGTVIGGETSRGNYNANSFLSRNQEGMRITVIQSRGSARGAQGSGGIGGGVQIYEVPRDTDFLEMIVFYSRLDPRQIRQRKIRILRLEETGPPPFYSETIKRTWTQYNFRSEYRDGGPFTVLKPGDIIIVEGRGIFNRRIFDPLADINFLLGLPTVVLSAISLYQIIK